MLVAKSPSGFDQRQNPFFKGELLQDGMEDALPGLELFGGMQTLSALCVALSEESLLLRLRAKLTFHRHCYSSLFRIAASQSNDFLSIKDFSLTVPTEEFSATRNSIIRGRNK